MDSRISAPGCLDDLTRWRPEAADPCRHVAPACAGYYESLQLQITPDHWLRGARRAPSPHCDARTDPRDIALVVVHGISLPAGQFVGDAVERLFCGTLDNAEHASFADLAGLRVSSHLFIRRDGELVQFVPFNRRAWHAGVSGWRGRAGCNNFSIGIELEGEDHTPYASAQYGMLFSVLNTLFDVYPALGADTVVGHQEIAPGRKTDPGPAFDWAALLAALHT